VSDAPGWETNAAGTVGRGLAWSFVNNLVSRVGQLAVGIVLARVLAPRDFGLFAIAMVVYAILTSISELGLSVAIVRQPARTAAIAPTVATLSLLSGALLTLLSWAAAEPLARALGDPAAASVIRVMAFATLIAGATAVPSAILQRDFRQDLRMWADTANLVVSTTTALALAFNGAGAMSLAWSRIAGNGVAAVVLYAVVRERHRPGFDRRAAGSLVVFGLPLTAGSLLWFAILNADYVVVGSHLGAVQLGFYVLAFNIASWPISVFSSVVRSVSLPAFARLGSGEGSAEQALASAARILLAVAGPFCALLAVLGRPTIEAVYGARWTAAAGAVACLSILGVLRLCHELAYDYLVATGRSRAVLRVQLGWLLTLCPALLVGVQQGGLVGVGIAHLVVAALVVMPLYARELHAAGVPLGRTMHAVVRPLVGIAVGGAVAAGVQLLDTPALVTVLVAGSAGMCAHLAVVRSIAPAHYRSRKAYRGWRAAQPV
jgi:PST family polysaccharide transporter